MKEHSDIDIIWEFHRRLIQTYKKENLKCIAGLDGSYEINGENAFASFMDAIKKGQEIYKPFHKDEKPRVDYMKLNSDLKLVSDEILHFTGLVCLYSSYLTSPLDSQVQFSREFVYPFYQDLPDKRFFMYATCALEKLYNYWDRIGDLLASFFPEKIKPERVYFSKIDKFIPENIQLNENIKWLIDFKQNEFTDLNNLRKEIVHYESIDTTFSSEHLEKINNRSQLEILLKKRSELIPILKIHMDLTLEGFLRTIRFMEYLNEAILTDQLIEEKRKAVHNPAARPTSNN